MIKEKITISTEYITLGSLLKFAGLIQQGCEAANFLNNNNILVNGEPETRRGRKIYPNYVLVINGDEYLIINN